MNDKESALVIVETDNDYFLAPAAALADMQQRYDVMVGFVKSVLKDGVDFGKIPGTGDKPTLLKPGAEKLCTLFGLQAVPILEESTEDWTGKDHDGEAFFYYRYTYQLMRGERVVAAAQGSANSWEKKYRYRRAELVCPACGMSAVIKGKEEFGGGWLCWNRKGGCGAKWNDGDQVIESQPRGDVVNPDPADLVNTLQKMAQKRALVAAVLIAANASEFFTQDIEDMGLGSVIDAEIKETTPGAATKSKQQPRGGVSALSSKEFFRICNDELKVDNELIKSCLMETGNNYDEALEMIKGQLPPVEGE